jgi:hypothetical protein
MPKKKQVFPFENNDIRFLAMPWLVNVLAIVGKFSVSFNFNGIYIISSELYPTIIRSTMMSFFLCSGHLGSVTAPYIELLVSLSAFAE